MSASQDRFIARNPWIANHSQYDPNGQLISPHYLVMKLMYQKNLLEQGRFHDAKTFGKDEGLHDTTAYRLLGDIDVPQSTIVDRLDEDKRMHINPTVNRGSYLFQWKPDTEERLIHDPQTIHQLYWHDKSLEVFERQGAKAAAQMAMEKRLAMDMVFHYKHHQIYRRAIKELDLSLAKLINDRENLKQDWRRDFQRSCRRHLKIYLQLSRNSMKQAYQYADKYNFAVFENSGTLIIQPTITLGQDQRLTQEQVPTLFSTMYH